jgi:hypothetical protein
MWAFSSERVTVYAIQPERGFEQAAAILGADFDRFLARDRWRLYQSLPNRRTNPAWSACSAGAGR